MSQNQVEPGRSTWVENLFRPLVVGVMVGCIAWSMGQLVRMFAPSWNPTYLIIVCVLAALEAFYSHWVLQTRPMFSTNVLRFRIVEMLVIFVLLKLGGYVGRSLTDILAEIRAWPYHLSLLFDLETMSAFALALLCWVAATDTAKDLESIGEDPKHREEAGSPVERLTSRFFVGGAVLLIAAGFARIGKTSELLNLSRPSVGGLVLNVLVYFLLGLVMLGQAHFLRLRRQWQGELVEVADELPRRWVRYSLAFVGSAALLAFLLPTGFTLNPLDFVAGVLGVLGGVLSYVVILLFAILSLPFNLLFWLLSILFSGIEQRPSPEVDLPTYEPLQVVDKGASTSWLESARTLIFWAVILAGLFFVVRSYFQDRPELRRALATFKPLQALRRGLAALWQLLKGWGGRVRQTVGERLPRRVPRRPPSAGSPGFPLRFFRLGALSPRERVLYYYLSIVRRAGKQGFPRQSHQTPDEYSAALAPNLPQAQQDMEALTQVFVEARYSQHEVDPYQDRRARASWERVKAAVRSLKTLKDPNHELHE